MAELLDRKSIQLKELYDSNGIALHGRKKKKQQQQNGKQTSKNMYIIYRIAKNEKNNIFQKDVKYRRGITIRQNVPFVPFISVIYVPMVG